jgi:hypothetical protein
LDSAEVEEFSKRSAEASIRSHRLAQTAADTRPCFF